MNLYFYKLSYWEVYVFLNRLDVEFCPDVNLSKLPNNDNSNMARVSGEPSSHYVMHNLVCQDWKFDLMTYLHTRSLESDKLPLLTSISSVDER